MSRAGPSTLTCLSASLSRTRRLYFHPFGPLKVIDGTLASMASTVAVMVRCAPSVPPGLAPAVGVTAAEVVFAAASPGFLRRTVTLS